MPISNIFFKDRKTADLMVLFLLIIIIITVIFSVLFPKINNKSKINDKNINKIANDSIQQ